MGGSGGMFGSAKQKTSGAFKMSNEGRLGEAEAINRQRAIANGTAPSIAQMELNNNIDQTNKAALAMAASQRGASNPMLAFRQAQMAGQEAQMQGAQQGAIMAEQERRMADQFLQQTAMGQRGVAAQSAISNQNTDAAKANSERSMIAGLGGAAVMASDEDAKENIKPKGDASGAIESFVNAIKPYSYEYKDQKHGSGEKVGVMAQDLEKSQIGQTMVDEAPDGTKMVDTNKAIGAILAGMADMNKKLKKLEK